MTNFNYQIYRTGISERMITEQGQKVLSKALGDSNFRATRKRLDPTGTIGDITEEICRELKRIPSKTLNERLDPSTQYGWLWQICVSSKTMVRRMCMKDNPLILPGSTSLHNPDPQHLTRAVEGLRDYSRTTNEEQSLLELICYGSVLGKHEEILKKIAPLHMNKVDEIPVEEWPLPSEGGPVVLPVDIGSIRMDFPTSPFPKGDGRFKAPVTHPDCKIRILQHQDFPPTFETGGQGGPARDAGNRAGGSDSSPAQKPTGSRHNQPPPPPPPSSGSTTPKPPLKPPRIH